MKFLTVFVAVMLVAFVVIPDLAQQTAWANSNDNHPTSKTGSIVVTNAHVNPDFPTLVNAFIPTGSKSIKCLVTMNDTTFVAFGTVVFCAQRESPTYGSGVELTIDYFDIVPPDYFTSLTLWQAGAKYYREPIPCKTAGVC